MKTEAAESTISAQVALREPDVADEAWDWEAFRVDGKLYLYCYLRETVLIPVTGS